jgi:hypothetical protein
MTRPSQISVRLRAAIFLTPFLIRPQQEWQSQSSSELLFSSYPLQPASPQATLRHHHPLTDSLFHYPISTQISQRRNLAWTQVTGQPDLTSSATKPDMSPNPAHDLTQLTEQLDPDAASLLPRPVPLGQAAPCAPCRIVSMLNPASDNPAHLAQLPLRLCFPLPPPQAWTEARKKLFPQNQNRLKIHIGFGKELWKILFWILKILLF